MSWQAGQLIEAFDKNERLMLAAVLGAIGHGVRVVWLNGRESTLTERQVLHATREPAVRVGDRDALLEALRTHDQTRDARATLIDLAELHAVVVDEARPFSLAELAGLLFDTGDETAAAAMLRRLHRPQLHFRLRKEGFVPIPAAEVAQLEAKAAAEARREAEDQALAAALKQAGRTPSTDRAGWPAPLTDAIDGLIDLALFDDESAHAERLRPVIGAAGIHGRTGLTRLLTSLGVFAPGENLALRRHRIPTAFADDIVALAAGMTEPCPQPVPPRDLTAVPAIAIDNPGTRDRDDAFSLIQTDRGWRLSVHIADPTVWFDAESPLDAEARRRAITLYFPDGRLPMLPPVLSEQRLSLEPGEPRRALSILADLDPDGEIVGFELTQSIVTIGRAGFYPDADRLLAEGDPTLAAAVGLAGRRRARRIERGALVIPRREIEVRLGDDGRLAIAPVDTASPTRLMIEEWMILANHLAARFARERGLPFLYRRQDPPDQPLPSMTEFDPVRFYGMRRQLKRTAVETEPGPHSGLGIDIYAQISSPIRRYADLLLMRQLTTALHGRPPQPADELTGALLLAHEAISLGERLMAERERYFLLRYLRQEQSAGHDRYAAIVVEVGPNRCHAWVPDLDLWQDSPPAKFPVGPGQQVTLKIIATDPDEGTLRTTIEPAPSPG